MICSWQTGEIAFFNLVSPNWEEGVCGYEFGIGNDELAVGEVEVESERIPGYAVGLGSVVHKLNEIQFSFDSGFRKARFFVS